MGASVMDLETPTIHVPVDPIKASQAQLPLANDPVDAISQAYANAPGASNNITVHRYPNELGTDPQYPHYLMFYINAREGSTIAGARSGRTDIHGDQTDQMRIDPANNGGNVGAAAGALATGLVTARVVSRGASQMLGGGSLVWQRGVAAVGGALVGGAAGAAGGALVGGALARGVAKPLVKIKDVIALHVSNPPSVAYKANWSEMDLGGLVGSGILPSSMTDKLWGAGDIAARGAAGMLSRAAGAGPDLRGVAESISRRVENPYKEQLFKSMGMRTFSFDYTFLPKSAIEARSILTILRIFKKNMHPELDPGKMFLIYPSEFNIVYYYRDQENPYVHKISNCVLTDMTMRFGDGRDFTSFSGGFPTQIDMHLVFLELEMLTGTRVDNDVNHFGTTLGF